ncbi:MAG: PD40 domain-containing protein [Chitinophagaceae bacterium]|nr:PD40 domain-containing protein [Chitinophagaceae bacterium]
MQRCLLFLLTLCFSSMYSQDKKSWDVRNPDLPYKKYNFTVTEGTWLNLDISKDGKTLAFDLLGDIYTMPVEGGKATCIRSGISMDVQPRFSPDGTKILFTSDAGGGDNIWVMDVDGKNEKQITKENFRLLNNAVWAPDGQYIIARKHFTSTRSLGAGELWIYHKNGGDGIQLTARKNDQQDLNEPSCSDDGRYVYYSEDMYPGGYFQYNKDPNNQIFVIKRYDREKGIIEDVTGGPGGAFRPQIAHDGKRLAFIKRIRTKSVLYIRDLETGIETPVYDHLSKDQQEAWTIFGVYTGFCWTPDDKNIIIWSEGKIQRIQTSGFNQSAEIPFSCDVNISIAEAVRFKQQINSDQFTAQVIRQAITSPDKKWLVFNALGYLWKKQLPDGVPERLTSNTDFEFEPSFSKDGKYIVFVTWNDSAMGSIQKLDLASGNIPQTLSKTPGIYRTPSFSSDNQYIVYYKEEGNSILGIAHSVKPGIYVMRSDGSSNSFVTNEGYAPSFTKKADRIFYQQGGGLSKSFHSCDLQGHDDITLFKTTYGSQFTISPNEEWVAFVDLHKVYVAPFPGIGKVIEISAGTTAIPVKQVAEDAGINLHWSSDSKELFYTLGEKYYTVSMEDRYDEAKAKNDSMFFAGMDVVSIGLKTTMYKPNGSYALTHARVITMEGDDVLEDATIVVEDNKIKSVTTSAEANLNGITTIDCSGKTIMPGFIDAHAHAAHFRDGITPQKHWPYYANLAFGVTTMHDPSANTEMVFAQSELVKSGAMIGPRVFSTGTILYGADGDFKAVINSLEDARSAIRRTKAFGAFSVKSYNQPRREQNQMVLKAAREQKIEVVPEGGSFYYHNLGMIIDGHTTIEHNLPIATMYDDVVQLWKRSKTAYTPTLIVCYGAVNGEYYWYQHNEVWKNERLLRFTPRAVLDTRSRFRTMIPEEEYENGHIQVSKTLKKLSDAGVVVNMGAHGQIQGIGAHWEIWMMQQGGMTNMEALRTATINPAKALGLDQYVGSIAEGKLADLLILDQNPLDNIRNTESIRYTIANGRMFDANTMNELGIQPKNRSKFYWELNQASENFPYHDGTIMESHLDD